MKRKREGFSSAPCWVSKEQRNFINQSQLSKIKTEKNIIKTVEITINNYRTTQEKRLLHRWEFLHPLNLGSNSGFDKGFILTSETKKNSFPQILMGKPIQCTQISYFYRLIGYEMLKAINEIYNSIIFHEKVSWKLLLVKVVINTPQRISVICESCLL